MFSCNVHCSTGDFKIFSNFGRHVFGTFGVEANIIMRRHGVPYPLSSDPEMIDLE